MMEDLLEGNIPELNPEQETTVGKKRPAWIGFVWEILQTLIMAVILYFLIDTVVGRVRVENISMQPTLHEGEFVLVNKLAYRLGDFQRGDVIVFHYPRNPSEDYIKRVIGLPGDRIQMREGLLYINDKPIKRERLSDFIGEDPCGSSDATARVKRWKETLPNGVSYESLDCVDNGFYDNTSVYIVPAGHFFMMGDNRDNSTDSRVLSAVGYVPFENIVGRAQMIFFSIAEGEHAWMFWRWPTAVRWNRLFSIVR